MDTDNVMNTQSGYGDTESGNDIISYGRLHQHQLWCCNWLVIKRKGTARRRTGLVANQKWFMPWWRQNDDDTSSLIASPIIITHLLNGPHFARPCIEVSKAGRTLAQMLSLGTMRPHVAFTAITSFLGFSLAKSFTSFPLLIVLPCLPQLLSFLTAAAAVSVLGPRQR